MNDNRRHSIAPVPRAPTQPGAMIDVLYISRHDTDSTALSKILRGTHWNLLRVRTCSEALATLDTVLVPVVMTDQEIDCDWKQIVGKVIHSPHPAPIIVTSEKRDWKLWEEVIDRGGFEVLCKPFERATTVTMLDAALHHWETGKIRRTWDAMEPRRRASGA